MAEQDAQLAALAQEAVVKACEALQAGEAAEGKIIREQGRDIKLTADLLLHDELTRHLFTDSGIRCLSEEDACGHGIPLAEPVWIVDPLDGSMNYQRGLPLFAVSVALWRRGEPVIGVVYDLPRERMLAAWGGRSRTPDELIRVSTVSDPGKAVLATGFPLNTDLSAESVGWFLNFSARFKKVRMLGSAALSLAWVAEGRLDAYFERDIMLWDVAAGAALVSGAGGKCLVQPGRHPMSRNVLAANPELAEKMMNVLQCQGYQ